jgi:hypothetical protein
LKDTPVQPFRPDRSSEFYPLVTSGGGALNAALFAARTTTLKGPLSAQEFVLLQSVRKATAVTLRDWFGSDVAGLIAQNAANTVLNRTEGLVDWRTLSKVNAAQAAIASVPGSSAWAVTAEGWPKTEAQIDGFIAVDFASPISAVREAASAKLDNMIRSAVTRGDLARAMLIVRKLEQEAFVQVGEIRDRLEAPLSRLGNEALVASYYQFKMELALTKKITLP